MYGRGVADGVRGRRAGPGRVRIAQAALETTARGCASSATAGSRQPRQAAYPSAPAPTVAAIMPSAAERRDAAWFRTEADRLASAGRYREAVQADFLALVLTLDGWGAMHFHPSKTPAEYLGEPALRGEAREEFRDLVRQLYRIVFGGAACDAADYAEWRRRAAPERYAPAH